MEIILTESEKSIIAYFVKLEKRITDLEKRITDLEEQVEKLLVEKEAGK